MPMKKIDIATIEAARRGSLPFPDLKSLPFSHANGTRIVRIFMTRARKSATEGTKGTKEKLLFCAFCAFCG